MTNERKQQFCDVAFKDEETAKKYLQMSPEAVAEALTAEGYDFTVDEIKELGAELQTQVEAIKNGELNEDDLDGVAGGKKYFGAGVAVGLMIGLALGGW